MTLADKLQEAHNRLDDMNYKTEKMREVVNAIEDRAKEQHNELVMAIKGKNALIHNLEKQVDLEQKYNEVINIVLRSIEWSIPGFDIEGKEIKLCPSCQKEKHTPDCIVGKVCKPD
jgi:hypothetical protein